jgi:hypothetical protein
MPYLLEASRHADRCGCETRPVATGRVGDGDVIVEPENRLAGTPLSHMRRFHAGQEASSGPPTVDSNDGAAYPSSYHHRHDLPLERQPDPRHSRVALVWRK